MRPTNGRCVRCWHPCARAMPPRRGAFRKSSMTCVEDGDRALLRYARQFDSLEGAIEVSHGEMRDAATRVPRDVRAALRAAARNIGVVAKTPGPARLEDAGRPGCRGRTAGRSRSIASGCYVPAGRYPLPSSLLMTAIPASAAGVREIIVACPRPAPVIMAAALEAQGHADVSRRRGARNRGARLRDEDSSAGRQDRGSRQSIRRSRKSTRRRRLRHRFLRRPNRDRHRRLRAARLSG